MRRHTLTIFKHTLSLDFHQEVELPYGARILDAQVQNGKPRLWFGFIHEHQTPAHRPQKRHFVLLPTGGNYRIADGKELRYVATLQLHGGEIMVHVYEEVDR
jgi:hypothetical protein